MDSSGGDYSSGSVPSPPLWFSKADCARYSSLVEKLVSFGGLTIRTMVRPEELDQETAAETSVRAASPLTGASSPALLHGIKRKWKRPTAATTITTDGTGTGASTPNMPRIVTLYYTPKSTASPRPPPPATSSNDTQPPTPVQPPPPPILPLPESTAAAVPVKRGRGRPRKHPRPVTNAPVAAASPSVATDTITVAIPGWNTAVVASVAPTPLASTIASVTRSQASVSSAATPTQARDGEKPWDQLTVPELARLRRKMKKNLSWTPSVLMTARELETLGRGPKNKEKFRHQWENTPQIPIPPVQGGIGGEFDGLDLDRENMGLILNRAKRRKRELERQKAEEEENAARRAAGEQEEALAARIAARRQGDLAARVAAGEQNAREDYSVEDDEELLIKEEPMEYAALQDLIGSGNEKTRERHDEDSETPKTPLMGSFSNIPPPRLPSLIVTLKPRARLSSLSSMPSFAIPSEYARPVSSMVRPALPMAMLPTNHPPVALVAPPVPTPPVHVAPVAPATAPTTSDSSKPAPQKYNPELLLPLFSANELKAIRKRHRRSISWTPAWITMERELEKLGRCIPEVIMSYARLCGPWTPPGSSNQQPVAAVPPKVVAPLLSFQQHPPVASMSSIQESRFEGFPGDDDTEDEPEVSAEPTPNRLAPARTLPTVAPSRPNPPSSGHPRLPAVTATRPNPPSATSPRERPRYMPPVNPDLADIIPLHQPTVMMRPRISRDPDTKTFTVQTPEELQDSLRDLISRNDAFIPSKQSCTIILSPTYPLPPAPRSWTGGEWPKNILEMNKFIALNFNPEEHAAQSDTAALQRCVSNHVLGLVSEVDGYEYQLKKTAHQHHGGWKREFVCRLGKSGRPAGRVLNEKLLELKKHDCGGVVKFGLVTKDGNVEVHWKHLAVHRSAAVERMEMEAKKEHPPKVTAAEKIAAALAAPRKEKEKELNMDQIYRGAKGNNSVPS